MSEGLQERQAWLTCPLCREDLGGGEAIHDCPGCSTAYHHECVLELGGCGTIGCAERQVPVAAQPRVDPKQQAAREAAWRTHTTRRSAAEEEEAAQAGLQRAIVTTVVLFVLGMVGHSLDLWAYVPTWVFPVGFFALVLFATRVRRKALGGRRTWFR